MNTENAKNLIDFISFLADEHNKTVSDGVANALWSENEAAEKAALQKLCRTLDALREHVTTTGEWRSQTEEVDNYSFTRILDAAKGIVEVVAVRHYKWPLVADFVHNVVFLDDFSDEALQIIVRDFGYKDLKSYYAENETDETHGRTVCCEELALFICHFSMPSRYVSIEEADTRAEAIVSKEELL